MTRPMTAPTDTTMPRAPTPTAVACNGCGTIYGEAGWRSLPLSERITPPAVRRLVSHWPEGFLIEVRRCSRCGRSIAAKRTIEEGPPTE
jgi:hypothetical protein